MASKLFTLFGELKMKKIILALFFTGVLFAQDGIGYKTNNKSYEIAIIKYGNAIDLKFDLATTNELELRWGHDGTNPTDVSVLTIDTTGLWAKIINITNDPSLWDNGILTYLIAIEEFDGDGTYRIYVRTVGDFPEVGTTTDWVYNSGGDFLLGTSPDIAVGVGVSGN